MEPLDEADDATTDPMEIFIDAGSKAMLAALAGDAVEELRQIKRGRAAHKRMRDAQILAMFDEADSKHRSMKRTRQEQRDQMVRSAPVATNLGDLLRNAGIVATDKDAKEEV